MKQYLSIKELAAELDMSYSWADKSARKGLIRFVWIGNRRKVPAVEVKRIKRDGIEGAGF